MQRRSFHYHRGESDVTEVIKSLNHSSKELTKTRNVLEEIEDLARDEVETTFAWCPRLHNSITHNLAIVAANLESNSSPSIKDSLVSNFSFHFVQLPSSS